MKKRVRMTRRARKLLRYYRWRTANRWARELTEEFAELDRQGLVE